MASRAWGLVLRVLRFKCCFFFFFFFGGGGGGGVGRDGSLAKDQREGHGDRRRLQLKALPKESSRECLYSETPLSLNSGIDVKKQ